MTIPPPMAAQEYDFQINNTIPYYSEFYEQTMDVVEQSDYPDINWLDLGCGTGTLEELALKRFPSARFVLIDPSEKMLEQAKHKLREHEINYFRGSSADISFNSEFEVVTAIQSHHYMTAEERQRAVHVFWFSYMQWAYTL